MKLIVSMLMMIPGLAPPLIAAEAKPTSPPADLSATLNSVIQQHKIPGMVAAVVRGDQIVAQGLAGVRAADLPQKVTLKDKFHIGSNTKAMTATLCAMLVEEGKLSWTTTLGQAFPELKSTMDPGYAAVTLEQLLTSTAGFSPNVEPDLWRRLYAQTAPLTARRTLLRESTASAPTYAPGSQHVYSNTSFAAAGHMAEKVVRVQWEDLMRQRLFSKLKMISAGFGAPGSTRSVDQPRGHTADGKVVAPGLSADNPAAIGPAGTVHASLADYAAFISLHLAGAGGKSGLLKTESFKKLHTPAQGTDYAMGWSVAKRPWSKGPILTHSGSNTMWYAVVWMAPAENFAVIIMSNKGGSEAAAACDDAAGQLIQWAKKNP